MLQLWVLASPVSILQNESDSDDFENYHGKIGLVGNSLG